MPSYVTYQPPPADATNAANPPPLAEATNAANPPPPADATDAADPGFLQSAPNASRSLNLVPINHFPVAMLQVHLNRIPFHHLPIVMLQMHQHPVRIVQMSR